MRDKKENAENINNNHVKLSDNEEMEEDEEYHKISDYDKCDNNKVKVDKDKNKIKCNETALVKKEIEEINNAEKCMIELNLIEATKEKNVFKEKLILKKEENENNKRKIKEFKELSDENDSKLELNEIVIAQAEVLIETLMIKERVEREEKFKRAKVSNNQLTIETKKKRLEIVE